MAKSWKDWDIQKWRKEINNIHPFSHWKDKAASHVGYTRSEQNTGMTAVEILLSLQPCNSVAGGSFPALGPLSGCSSKALALTVLQASARWEGICLLPADSSRSSPPSPVPKGTALLGTTPGRTMHFLPQSTWRAPPAHSPLSCRHGPALDLVEQKLIPTCSAFPLDYPFSCSSWGVNI